MSGEQEGFSAREKELLAPYVTNSEGPVFALTNLPEVIKGALFSRYSRSTLGLRRLLLKEFIQDSAAEFAAISGQAAGKDPVQAPANPNWRWNGPNNSTTGFWTATGTTPSASWAAPTWRWKTSP